MKIILGAMILLAVSQQCALAKPASINSKVDINGYTYRVVVRGDEIRVISKTIASQFRGRSVERRREMLSAAEKVAGCPMVHEFWVENVLVGEMACAASTPAPLVAP